MKIYQKKIAQELSQLIPYMQSNINKLLAECRRLFISEYLSRNEIVKMIERCIIELYIAFSQKIKKIIYIDINSIKELAEKKINPN